MNARKRVQLGLLVCLPVIMYLIIHIAHWIRWREHCDIVTGVAVELRPAHQVIRRGEPPTLFAVIINRGKSDVILVQPGDGSESGWRTPAIEWSVDPWFRSIRCGNMNTLKPEEVFTLAPEESKPLSDWIGAPEFASVGRYRVAVRYTNDPQKTWWDSHSDDLAKLAHQKVQGSARVTAVSNSVDVIVVE